MTNTASVTEQEIEKLKVDLQDAKRKKELVDLRNELEKTVSETVNTPNEFEGAMQVPDTIGALKTKRKFKSFVDILIGRLGAMLSPRPVVGNVIAIGVAILALVYLQTELTEHHLVKYQHYIGIGLLIFAAIQVIKSGTRSLIIPLIATVVGASVSHTLSAGQTLFSYGSDFYQYVMIVGIIGLGFAAVSID